ncbi:hypothetical protein Vretifemale_4325 [Volvox reticuliferus]|uniref:Uncharacterized protein n=1 Tax=Volvox reticuliferus TaxID=1737510 RepID=A0A8J4C2V9_9CHLO|nr:hypothetical protein Vretifemale_4325 [Volvox reticuliferus]
MFTAEDKFYIEVTGDALDVMKYINHVADPAAGAISTFSGVTRNNFQGKSVIKLEYEAYTPMALKKLEELAHDLARKWNICKVSIAHRVGTVHVGEPSVIIAVSSAHRGESLEVELPFHLPAQNQRIISVPAKNPSLKTRFLPILPTTMPGCPLGNRRAQSKRTHMEKGVL